MQSDKRHSLIEHVAVFSIASAISMPLFSNWLGSAFTYLFYLLGMSSAFALNYKSHLNFSRFDIPVFIFFTAYLFSVIYAVNPYFQTELLFIPLLLVLYYGGEGVAKRGLTFLIFTYTSLLFVLFSIYLLLQLSKVNYTYTVYFLYSNALNKVDYLTTAMFAGITVIYALIGMRSNWLRFPLAFYAFFIIAISGARFSIFFISAFIFGLFVIRFKKIILSKIFLIFIVILSLTLPLWINQAQKQWNALEGFFSFSIMRISNFNDQDTSLNERAGLIVKSIDAINKHPFLGYGINSGPKTLHAIYPHNMLLEVWLDTGIIGVLALSSIVIIMLSILYISLRYRDLVTLGFINLYIILAHLKSFSIIHSLLFFTFAGISVVTFVYVLKSKKQDYK